MWFSAPGDEALTLCVDFLIGGFVRQKTRNFDIVKISAFFLEFLFSLDFFYENDSLRLQFLDFTCDRRIGRETKLCASNCGHKTLKTGADP